MTAFTAYASPHRANTVMSVPNVTSFIATSSFFIFSSVSLNLSRSFYLPYIFSKTLYTSVLHPANSLRKWCSLSRSAGCILSTCSMLVSTWGWWCALRCLASSYNYSDLWRSCPYNRISTANVTGVNCSVPEAYLRYISCSNDYTLSNWSKSPKMPSKVV